MGLWPLLGGGASIVVGLVGPDGAPHAARGWGIDLAAAAEGRVGVLVKPVDLASAGLAVGRPSFGAMAVTAADVATLESVQLKGAVIDVHAATSADVALLHRHCNAFFRDVVVADHLSWEAMERWRPTEVVRVDLHVTAAFTQTPGPRAGTPLDADVPETDRGAHG